MQCPICCDDTNVNDKVDCGFCKYETCRECAKQYLLSTPESPHCMNCRKGWSREFMIDKLTSKFVLDDYKKHRENILFDKEKSLLPQTQLYAERELKVIKKQADIEVIKKQMKEYEEQFYDKNPMFVEFKIITKQIYNRVIPVLPRFMDKNERMAAIFLETNYEERRCDGYFRGLCGGVIVPPKCVQCMQHVCQICWTRYRPGWAPGVHVCQTDAIIKEVERREILREYRDLLDTHGYSEYRNQLDNMNEELDEMKREIHGIRREILRIPRVNQIDSDEAGPSTKKREHFVRACPVNDCRGFLSSAWKCGICNVHVCSKCHDVKPLDKKGPPHVCIEENVETAKLLAKDTKNCPSCTAPIFKINGCSQIWCTQCNTAFDWNTMKIVKDGPIHNPHYYEYLRKQGEGTMRRDIGDIPCGGLPYYEEIFRKIKKYYPDHPENHLIEPFHRVAQEVMDLRGWYRNRNLEDNLHIRVKYLVKEYDDKQFKKMLQMRAKAVEKIQSIDQVLDMFVMVISMIFQRATAANNKEEMSSMWEELNGLRVYFNSSMEHVSKLYQCITPSIDEKIILHRVGERKA